MRVGLSVNILLKLLQLLSPPPRLHLAFQSLQDRLGLAEPGQKLVHRPIQILERTHSGMQEFAPIYHAGVKAIVLLVDMLNNLQIGQLEYDTIAHGLVVLSCIVWCLRSV